MIDRPFISLCLPTNGIIEWVFPVLDSIYSQGIDIALFEVIVTDNGNNEKFYNLMSEYQSTHRNLIYKKTNAFLFNNQLEALKLGTGHYLKIINHRAVFCQGALKRIIDIVESNIELQPVLYFSNGTLSREEYDFENFDTFVRTLGIYASWTTGVGIWKEKYDQLPSDLKVDKISPHSCILFSDRNNKLYKILNFEFSREIDSDHSKKGRYDLFKAFGVEEISIIQNLYIDGNISANTLKSIKKDYRKFVSELYLNFLVRKKPCSYDLSGFNDVMGIYFSKYEIIFEAYYIGFKKVINKILERK